MTIHGMLFDLDGTLVDTLGDLAWATNEALRRKGFPTWPEEAYRQMVGNGARKLIERALDSAAAPARTEELLADFLQIYDAHCLCRTQPYEGIPPLLECLRQRNIRLGVVTNKPEAQALKIVHRYFGEDTFAVLFGGIPGRPTKPDPFTTREAMRILGTKPEETWFIGDSNVDIETAHRAGLRAAGAIWGFRGEEELRTAGANLLLARPMEILNFC